MLSRRTFLLASASSASAVALRGSQTGPGPLMRVAETPDSVVVVTEGGLVPLSLAGKQWQGNGVELGIGEDGNGFDVDFLCPAAPVLQIHLRWNMGLPLNLQYLGDAWERSYGDLGWRGMEPERVMPWYFLAFDGRSTFGCGVRTGAAALCYWQTDPDGVSLSLDLRNGGRGVRLGSRRLRVASVVAEHYPEAKPFQAAKLFCRTMASAVCRMPAAPLYGGNNWYYAYGKSSAEDIRADSNRIASFAGSNTNRPFMVIDDGWQPNPTAGPWSTGNARFPDMHGLASQMKSIGVQPGLWLRPLYTKEDVPASWRLRSPNAVREYAARQASTLDPTVPEALEQVKRDIRTAVDWGYGLLKHDFSTYDLLGRWGSTMNAEITDAGWSFADGARTNAEIIRDFYAALREAAGQALLLGCNTVGHLAVGLFEAQRTGDDTSGREWDRTRRMGTNTLAFRAPQHGAFFAIDADCAGITKQVPWGFNRQWLDLLARSGTPLFVSAAPDALGSDQRTAIREAFATAAKRNPLLEPMDWLQTTEPETWLLQGERKRYDWFTV